MDIRDIILIICGLINFLFCILLFSRSRTNKTNQLFGFVLLLTMFWIFSMLFFRISTTESAINFFALLPFLFGLLIAVPLLLFSYAFPFKLEEQPRILKVIVWVGLIIVVALLYLPGFILSSSHYVGGSTVQTASARYIIYIAYFTILGAASLVELYKKYQKSAGSNRFQVRWVLVGIAFALLAGSIFDILLPFNGNYYYNWLGPVSSVLMNLIIAKMIFVKSE